MEIGALIDRLRAAGLDVDWPDLRDMLWLAPQLTPNTRDIPENATTLSKPSDAAPRQETSSSLESKSSSSASSQRPLVDIDSGAGTRAAYAAGGGGGGASARRIELRGAPALPEALAIARALRPLSRRRAGKRLEVDERATAEFIADTGFRDAVWRSARERWFEIAIAIDDVPSLAVWGPTIARFERLLRRQGGFRDVRTLFLRSKGARVSAFGTDGREVPISSLQDRDGRRIVIVVSDCTAKAWRDGSMGAWIQVASRHMPVAVAQLLPQMLWPNTAIGFAEMQMRSPRLGAMNAEMRVKLPSWAVGEPGIVVPVFPLEPAAVARWAKMMSAAGDAWSPAALLPLPDEDQEPPDEVLPTEAQRFSRFRASATPEAQKLAAYLSVVRPLTPPVMRVVHWAMAPQSSAVALAQVFLAGIVFPLVKSHPPASPDETEYDFYPGLRDQLAQTLTRAEFVQVNLAVHDYLQQTTGTDFDFFALLEDATGSEQLPAAALPFVQASREFARKFGKDERSDTAKQAVLNLREPVAELHIAFDGSRLNFTYRSNRGQLTLRHEMPQAVTKLLYQALQGGSLEDFEDLAEIAIPAGLSAATAILQGPRLVELVVDETIDLFPWEILLGSPRVGIESLAVERGLTRRLPEAHRPAGHYFEESAQTMIVADPPTDQRVKFSVRRARQEADAIAALMAQALGAKTVHKFVAEDALEILGKLKWMEPRTLHVAANSALSSGTGLGPDFANSSLAERVQIFLDHGTRLTLKEFASMRRVPELIFLGTSYSAAIAPALIQLGATAVIGCFGQLNDQSARDFAIAFYKALVRGVMLIEAMREARRHCWRKHPSNPTWGQFQCYGDPTWRLLKRPPTITNAPEGIPPIDADSPRAWVLVAGSGGKNRLSAKVTQTCEALGVGLARAGYGLITSAWAGVDQTTIRSFIEELEFGSPHIPIGSRLIHVIPSSRKPPFEVGLLMSVKTGGEVLAQSIGRADFVILVGGSRGTKEIGERARVAGRPVLPLADTGGAARQLHRELQAELDAAGSEGNVPMNINVLSAQAPDVVGHALDMLESLIRQLPSTRAPV